MIVSKTCNSCGVAKPIDQFWSKRNKCIVCSSVMDKAKRDANPEAERRRRVKYSYSITLERYQEMWDEQGGLCAICGNSEDVCGQFAIDHDHRCCPGKRSCGECLRDLLCDLCNRGLGYFKDDIQRLSSAITYMKKWK